MERLVRSILVSLLLLSLTPDAKARVNERFETVLSDGTKHSALLSIPESLKKPLPVLIVLGGFDTGEKAISLLPDDDRVIYATTDYPYKKPHERNFVKDLGQIPAIKKSVQRVDLAVDALIKKLLNDQRIDSSKMTMVGASFGAPFTITAAARNSQLSGVVLIHAFGKVHRAIEQQLVNEWGGWSRPLAFVLGWAAWRYLDYSSPEHELLKLHSHQKVLYIYSTEDDQLPQISIDSFREGLAKSQAEVTSVTNTGGHLGPGKDEMIKELVDLSMNWLKAKSLL